MKLANVRQSILVKFILTIAVLIICTAIGISRFFLTKQSALYEHALITESEAIIQAIAESSELGILISNTSLLSDMLTSIQTEHPILFSSILDVQQQPIIIEKHASFDLRTLTNILSMPALMPETLPKTTTIPLNHPSLTHPSYLFISPVRSTEQMILDEEELLYFSHGLSQATGAIIGYALIVVSTEKIKSKILNAQLISSMITGIIICLGIGFGSFFIRLLLKPIRELMTANSLIADGNYNTQVDIISTDEIGQLSTSFNHMVKKIRIQQDELLDYSRTLEEKVAQRTVQLRAEKATSDHLLLNILPAQIATRLKQNESTIADGYDNVTILFSDIVGFTEFSTNHSPKELVYKMNILFSKFDDLLDTYHVEKIKTIGDALMLVSGAPKHYPNHANEMILVALDMYAALNTFNHDHHEQLNLRIGIHSGPVIAGVMGKKKFTYDLWGDTVNTASRMESHGVPGLVHISESTYQQVTPNTFDIEPRGEIDVKGKGRMSTYLLKRHQSL